MNSNPSPIKASVQSTLVFVTSLSPPLRWAPSLAGPQEGNTFLQGLPAWAFYRETPSSEEREQPHLDSCGVTGPARTVPYWLSTLGKLLNISVR